MSSLRLIGNILWLIFGGIFLGLAWWLIGAVALLSVVGIPWARACFVIGSFTFWPFGREAISRRNLTGQGDIGTGPFGIVGNIIWLILAGWWLALGHVVSAILDTITIIGIPFAIQHLKLAALSLFPIGLRVVNVEEAAALRRSSAEARIAEIRRRP